MVVAEFRDLAIAAASRMLETLDVVLLEVRLSVFVFVVGFIVVGGFVLGAVVWRVLL